MNIFTKVIEILHDTFETLSLPEGDAPITNPEGVSEEIEVKEDIDYTNCGEKSGC